MENRKKNLPQNYKPELCISSEEVDKEFGFSEEDYKDFEKIEFE